MANPQPTDAHLRIAHTILEQIMVSDFTKRQLSILLFILRLSWGCGKKEANIPRQGDFEIVGVGSGHIKAELNWLVESKVIYRNGNIYSFNKDYDQWRVSRAKGFHQEELTKMVRINLNHQFTKTVTEKLPKGEETSYQNGKSSTPNLASGKEILKKYKENNKYREIHPEEIAEIATLYEANIGRISPAVAEALKDAVRVYPAQWIKEAIKEAALREKKNWKYIAGILERWKGERSTKRGTEKATKVSLAYRAKRKELGRDLMPEELQEIRDAVDKELDDKLKSDFIEGEK